MSEKMTLEQVRNTLENWPADMPIPHIRDLAAAIDAHLATLPSAVPDAMKPHLFRETDDSEETARGEGYVEGWNACREAMLTQRGNAQGDAVTVASGITGDVKNKASETFAEYIAKNYPSGCVISDPRWHAPRIFRAAVYAIDAAMLNDKELP